MDIGQPQDAAGDQDSNAFNSVVLTELRRQTMALEKLVEFIKAYSQIEANNRPEAPKKQRIHRTEMEITRIVADAIAMVGRTGWSDSRIARELGVSRTVFNARKPYVDARMQADIRFSHADPDADLEE